MNPGRVPPQWAARKNGHALTLAHDANVTRIALINNMPDAALEDTELQFFELLENASHGIPVQIELFSLPGLERGERTRNHLDRFYSSTEELGNHKFDGAIITGTEPRKPDLREEPYWPALGRVFDWAERETYSTVLSCLAAHAGVLYSDGVKREPLGDKQFGVFEYARVSHHELLSGLGDVVRFPHSRWNEVRAEALTSCGYTLLTASEGAGVDTFVKKKRTSLFVHFQGHPEYGAPTLWKEYRRDIKRFLRRERSTYPSMPHGYFSKESAELLSGFRERLSRDPREEHMESFPDTHFASKLEKTWHAAAVGVYQNWLRYTATKKAERTSVAAIAQAV
jgi:homoserine O-succinyltransferase